MKLFVWEGDGVLEDYTSGMVVAVAVDLQAALKAVEQVCPYGMNSFPCHQPTSTLEVGSVSDAPKAWVCWGGG